MVLVLVLVLVWFGAGHRPARTRLHGERVADGAADPLGEEARGRLPGRRLMRSVRVRVRVVRAPPITTPVALEGRVV